MLVSVKRMVPIFIGALILVVAACAPLPEEIPTAVVTQLPTETSGIPITGTDLDHTQWALVAFNEGGTESQVISGSNVTLEFQQSGQAGGSSGCNAFSAQYQAWNGTLSFAPVVSTKMACTVEGVTEQEQKFFDALQSAERYELAGNTLRIWYANGQNSLTFSRATAATPLPPTVSPTALAPTIVNPSPTSGNANAAERITFAAGNTSASLTGTLTASGSRLYVLRALAGQTMNVDLSFTEGKAILVVWGQDGDVLLSDHAEASSFQRDLPTTQDYFIQVKGRPDGNSTYRMTVDIPASNTGMERIEFPSGPTSATVTGQLTAADSDQYVLRARAGQTMEVDLRFTEGTAILVVWGADGNILLSDHAEASSFRGELPTTQDDYIMVKGRPDGNTSYSMTVSIPPSP